MKNVYPISSPWHKGGKAALLFGLFFTMYFSAKAQTLVWEENFDGETINPESWTFDFGDGCERGICGWGNNEMQYYTSRPENARIESGNLLIEARKETFGSKQFTSARMKTYGRMHFKYGTLEARIKISDLKSGLWPAFWMLGATGRWPANGEIDILEMGSAEAIGNNVINRQVGAAVHWEHNNSHATHSTKHISEADLTDEYHLYKVTWDKEFIKAYIDGIEYFAINIAGAADSDLEEFHQSHYILLNLAVGGTYTGIHDINGVTAPLPGKMYVDYIRLYQNPADEGELYLGKNNAIAGNFGVYTETTPVSAKLTYGQDANLYIWNNLNAIDGAQAYEGNEVLALRADAGQWFGFGIANQAKNLLNFTENGSLKFHMKTSYSGQFRVGIASGHGESWINFPAGANSYGLVRDGNWHELTIPLSAFNNPNQGMHIDLGSIGQAFMLVGDPPAGNAEFYIDNIYYSGGATSNPAPTVAITSPQNNATYTANQNLTIQAVAADENGSVAKVEFYNGNFLLGTDTESPYSFTWNNVPAGVYNLTAKAFDNEGLSANSTVVNVTVNCVAEFYADNDGDGFGNVADKMTACEAPSGYISRAGDCNDNDATINPDATDLCDGIDRNCDGKVRTAMTVPVIAVIPSSEVYTGGDATTIYLGYGAQSVNLSASTNDATRWSWKSADGKTISTTATAVFKPRAAGNYTFNASATNASECSATAQVTIRVIDVRCGTKSDKVLVCHGSKVLCLTSNAVKSHLANGAKLGNCFSATRVADEILADEKVADFRIYPNPVEGRTTIGFTLTEGNTYQLSIYDLKGILIRTVANGDVEVGKEYSYELDASALKAGIYLIRLQTEKEVAVKRLVVQY